MLTAETPTCNADGVIGVDNTCSSRSHECIKVHDLSHGMTKLQTYLEDERYMIICHVVVFESEQSIIYICVAGIIIGQTQLG
jgi:hypothetical protein